MIHILTEDSTNGFKFCKLVKTLYFDNIFDDITLDTMNGIPNVTRKIQEKINNIGDNDKIIIVYDDIRENPIVDKAINDAVDYIDSMDLYDKIIWLPTYSFEIELLLITGIEFICNNSEYALYFWKLRKLFLKTHSISSLTKTSKADKTYDDMYESARKHKMKSKILYGNLSASKFESAITIETISKAIMSKVFTNVPITKPMGKEDDIHNCWYNNCCNRRNFCKNEYLDFDRIIKYQNAESLFKTKFLILNTSYKKLIKKIYELHEKEIKLPKITIGDMVKHEILQSNYVHKLGE